MKRSEQREAAFKMLFSADFLAEEETNELYERLLAANDCDDCDDCDYVRTLFFGVRDDKQALDALIEQSAKGWKLSRISRVSLCVMRLSICEMKNFEDVPFAVSINEAVELTRKYDDEKAVKFVNGVLNSTAELLGLK